MRGFDLSRRARRDLIEIGEFTAIRWGDDQSERYLAGLYVTFQSLVERIAVGRQCDHIRLGLWRVEHASHMVFFRRGMERLLICRVLHRRMLPEHQPMDDEDDGPLT
jgi:toxin ParE1/3/4